MNHDVFISFSTKDLDQVNLIYDSLEAAGISCWISNHDIAGGDNWASDIGKAVRACETVLLVFSRNSNESDYVRKEIVLANQEARRVIPVRIDNTVPTGGLEYLLADTQNVDAFEGKLEDHLETLAQVIRSPRDTSRETSAWLSESKTSETAFADAIRDIDWLIATAKQQDRLSRNSQVDSILESVLKIASPFYEAELWDECNRLYVRLASRLSTAFDSTPQIISQNWPYEIEVLRSRLKLPLKLEGQSDLEYEAQVVDLNGIFTDFLDRTLTSEDDSRIRKITASIVSILILVSMISLLLAYSPANTTLTWEMRYAYPLGPNQGRFGPYLEASRGVLIAFFMIYLFEVLFKSEYVTLILDWRRNSWKREWVTSCRVFGLLFFIFSTWTTLEYALEIAPESQHVWAENKNKSFKKDLVNSERKAWSEEASRWKTGAGEVDVDGGLKQLAIEERRSFAGNRVPYRMYLPYCLANYSCYAVLLLSLTIFSVLGDAANLLNERKDLFKKMVDRRTPDASLDQTFQRFFEVCYRHARRYVTLLVLLSAIIVYETLVTSKTLSQKGWSYELSASIIMACVAAIWVAVLVHFYESAFQRCCQEKKRRRRHLKAWEESMSTSKFLSKCFLNLWGGIAIGLNILPFVWFFILQTK